MLSRRTQIRMETRDHGATASGPAAQILGRILGWDSERKRSEVLAFRSLPGLTAGERG